MKKWAERLYEEYGLLLPITIFLAFAKIVLFYYMIKSGSNYLIIITLTCVLVLSLFSSIRYKAIPTVVYCVITCLMFVDIAYKSYFNSMPSVTVLSTLGMLGNITGSIQEVIQPMYFLVFIDIPFLLALLIVSRKSNKGKIKVRNRLIIAAVPLVLIIFFVANPFGDPSVRSIANQEVIIYHIKDIFINVFNVPLDDDTDKVEIKQLIHDDTYEDEKVGPEFGIAEGRNLYVIQVEALQDFVIDLEYRNQEITPVMNSLVENESVYFDNFYAQTGVGNTADAEFTANNSILGYKDYWTYNIFTENNFRGLPVLLGEKGYSTAVFHAFEQTDFWNREAMYPVMGFDRYIGGIKESGGDFVLDDVANFWGLSDESMFNQTVDYMVENMIEPYYAFIITLSNHHAFDLYSPYDKMIKLAEDEIGVMPYDYLNSVAYTDYAIGKFIEKLKSEGLYENSVVVIYGDHLGIPMEDYADEMKKILKKPYGFQEMMQVPCIIHIPGGGVTETKNVAGGQLDILPTLAYLMGFDELDTLYLGHNLMTAEDGLVEIQRYMAPGSYFTNDIGFYMSPDRVYDNAMAWDLDSGEEIAVKHNRDLYDKYLDCLNVIKASQVILEEDRIGNDD